MTDESGEERVLPWEPYTLNDWLEEERQRDPEWYRELVERMPARHLGNDLALSREDLGLTQAELAARTGIKQPMLSRIERGQEPTLPTLRKLAAALRVEIVIAPDGETMTVRAAAGQPRQVAAAA